MEWLETRQAEASCEAVREAIRERDDQISHKCMV